MRYENPNDAPKADSVTGWKCDHCEHLHLVLLDEDDLTLATAILDRTMIENMLKVIDGPPTRGETAH